MDAADFVRRLRTVPPLSEAERATLIALASQSRPAERGEYVARVAEIADTIGTSDPAAVALALFPLVGRRTERPPGVGEGEWSAVALVSGVRVQGPLCHVEWGPGMRPWLDDADPCESPADRARLAGFGLTETQIDEAAVLALAAGAERVERNLAYVEAELARGKEIEALGAYVYRAIQGDWGGRARAAQRKRDALRHTAAAQSEAARQSVFPPPALRPTMGRAHTECSSGVNRGREAPRASTWRARTTCPGAQTPRPADAPRKERQSECGRECVEREDVASDAVRASAPGVGLGRLVLTLVLAASSVGCSAERSQPAPDAAATDSVASAPVELLGIWDLAEIPTAFGECHEASIGYRADGRYVTKSGGQIVTGRFSAVRTTLPAVQGDATGQGAPRPGFVVVQHPEAHNGRPNCQGFPADVAVAQSPRAAFVEVERGVQDRPDEARVYFDPQATVPAVVLVRRTSGS